MKMDMKIVEDALDDAVMENAQLLRVLDQVGKSFVESGDRLRRAGQALLDLERTHPDLADEIQAMRDYIWSRRQADVS
jgi:hypothetical protein